MSAAFDDAFGSNFLQQAGPPAQDIYGFGNVDPVALNAAQQDTSITGYDPMASQPAYDNPAPQNNVMSQSNFGQPQPAPDIPVGSGQNPVRPRLSLIDTIGRLADGFAKIGGAPANYQPYIDQRVATQQAQRTNQLDQQAKQQDIAQTSVATQANANQVVGGYARGLQAIASAGGDPSKAAGPLAQQMGIPAQQAAAIMQMYSDDPKSLAALADAADAQKAGGAAKFANQPLITVDAQGKPHVLQLSNQGGAAEVQLPDGQTYSPKLTSVNTGDGTNLVNPNTGGTVHRYVKAGDPDAGSAPITDAQGNVIGYNPLPGTKGAQDQKIKADKVAEAKTAAQNNFVDARAGLTTLNASISSLLADPHLGSNLGMTGSIERHISGSPAHGIQAQIHVASGQQMQAVLGHLRTMSSNGTLGFRPSQQELNGLQSTLGAIGDTSQSETSYRANAAKAQALIGSMVTRMDAAHAATVPAAPANRTILKPTYKVVNW